MDACTGYVKIFANQRVGCRQVKPKFLIGVPGKLGDRLVVDAFVGAFKLGVLNDHRFKRRVAGSFA